MPRSMSSACRPQPCSHRKPDIPGLIKEKGLGIRDSGLGVKGKDPLTKECILHHVRDPSIM